MRHGTGKAARLALLVTALGATIPLSSASAATAATSSSLRSVQPPGASAAATVTIFTIDGGPAAARVHAYAAFDGRLVLSSPEGITAPSSPAGVCTQDNPTQVSCTAGAITAIAGDLGGGADSFTADSALGVAIGVRLTGADSPLLGGPGKDRLLGGAIGDLIHGGGGGDTIQGGGGTDVLRGEGGADRLNGGASPDALYGGAGPDKLNGGPARDLCVGGAAVDGGRSCTTSKSIP